MYESHFHLNDRPFASVPNPEHYFPASSIEQAREVVALNVERGSGVTILMGPVGSGKTLICQLIANQFSNELPVCMVQGGRIDTRELLLQSILHQLGLPFRGQDEGELRLILTDHVESQTCRNGFVLVIDEADRLPLELLEEVRALTNLVKEGEPCVRLVMAGGYPLEELIAHPRLESLNQRVIGRLYLENFNRDETGDYIRARINACGGDAGSIFIDEACDTVFQATNGVPRLVNQICDHAMLMASVGNIDQLRKSNIEEAWADLQQLPMPTAAQNKPSSSDVVVEFGSLDDEPEDDPAGQIDDIQRVVAELENEASEAVSIEIGGVEIEEEYHDDERVEIEFDSPAAASVEIEMGSEVEIDFGSDVAIVDSPEATVEFTQEATEVEVTPDVEISSEVVVESDSEVEFEQHQDIEAGEGVAVEFEQEQELEADQEVEIEFGGRSETVSMGSDETHGVVDYPESPVVYDENSLTADGHDAADEFDPEQTVEWTPRSQYEAEDQQADGEELEFANEEASDDPLPERHSPFADEMGFAETADCEVDVVEDDSQMAAQFEQHFVAANEEAVELTIDQATNPFDEEFADEEIVIQEFVSPSKIARGEFEHVSSAYSRRLAEQLTAAHPGLRMHFVEASEFEDDHESDTAERFEPLSAYLNDEPQAYADSSYAGSEVDRPRQTSELTAEADPVLPDVTSVSIGSGPTDVEAAPSLAIHDPSWDGEQDESTEQSSNLAEEDAFSAEQPPSGIVRPSREKVFRTLFSRMRRA